MLMLIVGFVVGSVITAIVIRYVVNRALGSMFGW